jgi:hypothetical protein
MIRRSKPPVPASNRDDPSPFVCAMLRELQSQGLATRHNEPSAGGLSPFMSRVMAELQADDVVVSPERA